MPTSSKRRSPASPDVAYARHATPLGEVIFAGTDKGLVGCWFHDQAHLPTLQTWQHDQQLLLLRQAHQQWLAYLKGELKQFDLPLHFLWGTPFQQSVWTALQNIPYGQTTSYADIAHAVARASAFRAVGAAVGRNPLSVIVPCHRVMGASGALTGYAGGLPRKQHLLQLEAQHA
jgi:methylated-DNA-[protein]-cysteine S-methyltransferase